MLATFVPHNDRFMHEVRGIELETVAELYKMKRNIFIS
jgi:hypothetical protein